MVRRCHESGKDKRQEVEQMSLLAVNKRKERKILTALSQQCTNVSVCSLQSVKKCHILSVLIKKEKYRVR